MLVEEVVVFITVQEELLRGLVVQVEVVLEVLGPLELLEQMVKVVVVEVLVVLGPLVLVVMAS
jgi:hypothetical protein